MGKAPLRLELEMERIYHDPSAVVDQDVCLGEHLYRPTGNEGSIPALSGMIDVPFLREER